MITRIKNFSRLTLLGIPGFVVCGAGHICMAGHMQHPPYGWWEIAIDASWTVSFTAASFIAFRSALRRRVLIGGLLLSLLVSRLALGSLGGGLFLLELPAMLYLGFVSWRGVRRNVLLAA